MANLTNANFSKTNKHIFGKQIVTLSLFSPQEHVGKLMEYIHERRGTYIKMETLSSHMNALVYEIPLYSPE